MSGKVIDLLDVLPPFDPLKENRMADPVMPFLIGDSFVDWVSRRNYELGRPPLTDQQMDDLHRAWRK